MDLIVVITHLVTSPEYWAGVGSVILISLVGLLVFLTCAFDGDGQIRAEERAAHRRPTDTNRQAAAGRKARAQATNWPRQDEPTVDLLRYDYLPDQHTGDRR